MYGFRNLGVVDAVPAAGVAPGTGAAVGALKVELGNVLEITGTNAAPGLAGALTLLRWFPPPQAGAASNINVAGEWRIWREDAAMQLAAGDSQFSGRYDHPEESTEYWLLLTSAGATAANIRADAQCVYYRGRK